MRRDRLYIGSSIFMLLLVPALRANAQTAGGDVLEEIVVSAEKRLSTVQETPISITALSGKELAAQGLVSTQSLANVTPGLTIQRDVIGKVVIRGVGTENDTIGSDPGVAIYQDGLYIARSSVSMFDFYDTNRIEVLRGPQGTLYGRNATGGVINIVSSEPTDTFGGYANLDVGDYNKRRLEMALNMPIGERIQTRLSVLYATRDGYTKNIFPGQDAVPADTATGFPGIPAISDSNARSVRELDNQDLLTARGQVRIKFTDDVSLLLLGQFSRDKSLAAPFKYLDTSNAYWFNAFPQNQNIANPRVVSEDYSVTVPGTNRSIPSPGNANQQVLSGKLTWNLGAVNLTAISGWRKTDFTWLNDGDGFDVFFVNYFQNDHSRQFTQEVQLTNVNKDRIDWIVGAYYLNEKSKTFEGIPFLFFGPNPSAPYLLWDGVTNTKSYSAYAQGTYSWTDRLKTTLGVRYNTDQKDGSLIYNPFGLLGANPAPQPLNGKWNSVTPKFGANYEFSPDKMAYLSATRGYKSGGFNLLAVQDPYSPESLWAYELGLKTKSFNGRLIANFDIFYYDYSNMQVSKTVNLANIVANAGKATIKGAEIELRAAVGGGLEINAGLAFLDAKFDEFVTQDPGFTGDPAAPGALGCGVQFGPQTAVPNREVSLAGCRIPRSSKFQNSLGVQWSRSVGEGQVRLRADYAYRSNQFFSQFNRDSVSQSGYGTVGARASYAGAGDRWSITLYGENLTDKLYFTDILESGVAAPGTVVPQNLIGPPRTFGVVLGTKF